jgi:adenylyltransferase/sulfurtransferase
MSGLGWSSKYAVTPLQHIDFANYNWRLINMEGNLFSLTDYDRNRYTRQMMISGWGNEGQLKLKNSTVFIAGAGGLGNPVATYLTVAGVGVIKICDFDKIEVSNLNRHILYNDRNIGDLKVISAARTLRELNPFISISTSAEQLNMKNIDNIIGKPDVIVDCLDNFETRFLLNHYCVAHKIPVVYAAVRGMVGQITFLIPPETPCLQCIFPEIPPKEVSPILGATPGIVGSIQAMEVLKFLTGIGTLLKNRLLIFDGEEMTFNSITIRRKSSCPECGK